MSVSVTDSPDKQGDFYKVGNKKPPIHTRFKSGDSGNPRGRGKGRHSIPHAYERLLLLSPERLEAYKPKNSAEAIAKKQIQRALEMDKDYMSPAIRAVQEITDRTEGKAVENKHVTGSQEIVVKFEIPQLDDHGRNLALPVNHPKALISESSDED